MLPKDIEDKERIGLRKQSEDIKPQGFSSIKSAVPNDSSLHISEHEDTFSQ